MLCLCRLYICRRESKGGNKSDLSVDVSFLAHLIPQQLNVIILSDDIEQVQADDNEQVQDSSSRITLTLVLYYIHNCIQITGDGALLFPLQMVNVQSCKFNVF